MTKQNDMPDEIYAWPWTLDDQTQHWQITDDGTGVRYVRADKPADNGGENCPDGMSCSGNGMDCVGDGLCKGPEVSGDVDVPNLRDEFVAMDWFRNCETASDIVLCTIIEMQQRNLLKSEGVCVPGEIIQDINKSLIKAADALSLAVSEVRQDTSIRGKADYWTYKDALEAIRRKIEALHPFLPAEK